ncbi:MAG TPA: FAD-binding oxidoreductase [Bryobacteraceae bacterium]|nr:FAD-binding oxidoreductase [Bryobacteraceae bacterium]
MIPDASQQALLEWANLIGIENVLTDPALLTSVQTATFHTDVRVPAILKPGNTAEVVGILQIANRHQFPVYPVSSGKNWGYGSQVPTADLCALLDLGRMNRILDFNEDLAYVTVEPGVTQRQLFEYLQSRGGRLWMDASGASPDCSLIGNTMERGFGHTPYGDHFAHVCGLQVALGSGELVETGFSGYRDSQTGPVYRWGVGPYVDGLFSQSNLGVVTRMTVWLMPAPDYFEAFFFTCEKENALSGLVDALRPLRLNGTLRSTVHIGNDYKVLSGLQQYPWEHLKGRTPLMPADLAYFRRAMNFGCWNGSGGLYGTRAQVAEARRLLKAALKGKVSRLQFLDERKLLLATRFSRVYEILTGWDLSRTLDLARPVFGLLQGIPSEKTMGSVYWRKRQRAPEDADPNRDGCGLLWCAPITPLEGGHAHSAAMLATAILLKGGFEPMLSLSMVGERAIACVVSISYDRDVPGEDGRAMECHHQLLEALVGAGYPPYRLGVQSMKAVHPPAGMTKLINLIRHAADPNGILAPGRYHQGPSSRPSAVLEQLREH